jgi:hypothetical protein
LFFGETSSPARLTWDGSDPTKQWQFGGSLVVPTSQAYRQFAADGTTIYTLVGLGGVNDNVSLGASTAGFTNVVGGPGGVYIVAGGASIVQAATGFFRPFTDNITTLGTAGQRWSTVYAATGTINTSDGRQKQQVRELSDAEKAVALRLKGLIRAFKFNDAVQSKGQLARIHYGVIAQDVKTAFEAEGLDANQYGLFCYDEWQEEPAEFDEIGNVTKSAIEAGNRYGVRYEELAMFMLGAL